jgi:hypothetical protein
MSVQTIIEEARALSLDEQKRLIKLLVDLVAEPREDTPARKRSLLEYQGLAAHLYDGTDAQEHVSMLRNEWDER